MPFKTTKELPESIKKLPIGGQKLFLSAFNKSVARVGEETAFKVAWAAVKKRFKSVDGKWVARGLGHQLFRFNLKQEGQVFVKRSKEGEFFLEGILSSVNEDDHGTKFTEETLKRFADQINERGINGFLTHQDWDKFLMENSHLDENEFVARALKERKGIIKSIKAIFNKGKLWVKALIDKRYVNHVRKFNSMSIEALVPNRFQKDDVFTGGHILGLALLDNPSNLDAKAQVVAA